MKKTFRLLITVGIISVATELIMRFFHSSICSSEGCKLVSERVRYGDISILIIGLLVFFVLYILSIKETRTRTLGHIVDVLLIIALTSEGFLVGYQIFRLHHICYFCFGIFIIFVLLSILRILDSHTLASLGFLCFAAILSLFWFVLPPYSKNKPLPRNTRMVLLYDKNCPHCKDVIKVIKNLGEKVCKLRAKNYKYLLQCLGINEVPVLIVSYNNQQKRIIVGEFEIEKYLSSLSEKTKNQPLNPDEFVQSGGVCKIGEPCR